MSEPLSVEVWSDVQCPWCYIGKRRFESALATWGGEAEIVMRSFELAPDTPVDFDGTTADYLAARKGMPPEQVERMLEHVTDVAAADGLEYRFDLVHQTSTVLAHEALHLAAAHGVQPAAAERLFRAYFTEGRHLGRTDVLVELLSEVGVDPAETAAALEDHRYLDAVRADEEMAQAYGIRGVPFFVLDGRIGVSGAQSAEVFVAALEQASRAEEPAA